MSSSLQQVNSLLNFLNSTFSFENQTTSTSTTMTKRPENRAPILLLFDVDGTLSPSRLKAEEFMWKCLEAARQKVYVGFVGGSDLIKQQEQLENKNYNDVRDFFDYTFSENGLVAFHNGKSINDHVK